MLKSHCWHRDIFCRRKDVGTGPEGGWVDPHPFLTEFGEDGWVEKMLAIQSVALERRMKASRSKRLVIGVSGGADSALALLAAARAVARANQNFKGKVLSTNQHESARIGGSPSALQTADLGTTADFGTVEKGVLAVVMPASTTRRPFGGRATPSGGGSLPRSTSATACRTARRSRSRSRPAPTGGCRPTQRLGEAPESGLKSAEGDAANTPGGAADSVRSFAVAPRRTCRLRLPRKKVSQKYHHSG